MANRLLRPLQGCLEGGVVMLFGSFTTTTSGTIGTSSAKGFSIAKTASETGRYTLTLTDKYTSLLNATITIEGAADAAYTTAKGLTHTLRNVSVAGTTPALDIQFSDPDGSAADAELESAAKVYITLTLKNTSSY